MATYVAIDVVGDGQQSGGFKTNLPQVHATTEQEPRGGKELSINKLSTYTSNMLKSNDAKETFTRRHGFIIITR